MNIDSIKNYPAGVMSNRHRLKYGTDIEGKSALKDNSGNSVNNRGYYGSFTGKEKAAENFLQKLAKFGKQKASAALESIIDACSDKTSTVQALVALVLATTLRPLAIMSLPGKKDKDDKIYASGHAIASGLIGFGFTSLLMYPLDKAAKLIKEGDSKIIAERFAKVTEEEVNSKSLTKEHFLKDVKILGEKFLNHFGEFDSAGNLIKLHKNINVDGMEKIINMAPDTIVFGVLKAMLTIALIPPILKYVFGVEKKKKPEPAIEIAQAKPLENPLPATFQKVKEGGLK